MKYIFLDIDGVFIRHSTDTFMEKPLATFKELVETFEMGGSDDLGIVITSDWRLTKSVEELKEMFPYEISKHIIGATTSFIRNDPNISANLRDREIAEYCNVHDIDPEDCVAIDDQWEITCVPMVKVLSPEIGFTEDNAGHTWDWLMGYLTFYDINKEVVELREF